jgi:isopenicillin N synthase-like dioxygenase
VTLLLVLASCKLTPSDRHTLRLIAPNSYVKGHGIPEKTIDGGFKSAKRFFDLDLDKKLDLDIHKSTNMKGYTKLLGENVDPANRGDMHEGMDFGTEENVFPGHVGEANQWPKDLPGFKEDVMAYL